MGHLSLGMPPHLQQRMKTADLIIALGTRLGDINTMTCFAPAAAAPGRASYIHPGPAELNRVYQADLAIAASPSAAAIRTRRNRARCSALERIDRIGSGGGREVHRVPQNGPRRGVDLAVVIRHLATQLPANAILSNGRGNFTVWVHRFFTYRQLHTELAPTSGAMGYGFPASIAASLRHPDRVSVCVAGDGDFLMYAQELATAAQYGARVIVLIANNGSAWNDPHASGSTLSWTGLGGIELVGPDFVALARSFGAHAERVETTDAFAPAFERVRRKPLGGAGTGDGSGSDHA